MAIQLTSWADVKAYISDIGYSHPMLSTQGDGRGMVIRYPDRKLDRESSENVYPLLELSPPQFQAKVVPGGRRDKTYDIQISTLTAVDIDDYRAQELAHESLEPVMDSIIAKMIRDKVLKGDTWKVFPVSNDSHDNMWGWAVSLSVEVKEAFCYGEEAWLDVVRLCPVWTEGETKLAIELDGISFEVDWEEDSYEARIISLKYLAEKIAEGEMASGGAFSADFFDPDIFDTESSSGVSGGGATDPDPAHLIVTGTIPGEEIQVSFPADSHSWKNLRESWL